MEEEVFPLFDKRGREIGKAKRSECHGNPKLIHGVVHLLLFSTDKKRVYLQKRARSKDRYPGYWDTSVGGHMRAGETVKEALKREVEEELGIGSNGAEFLYSYIYRDEVESEFVFTHTLVYSEELGEIKPLKKEIERGDFFTKAGIEKLIEKKEVTPTFLEEYKKLTNMGLI